MSSIAVLPPAVRSQIAAGEVIERPAAVVKELVENALDAGASRIDVVIDAGGRQLIRVTDDGCGMDADDLKVSVLRHATSKLRCADDLARIQTLGFRGEALPSIGAVSRLTITSRLPQATAAWRLSINGINGVNGTASEQANTSDSIESTDPDLVPVPDPVPAAAAPGTCVEVRELFARLPARLKFLKSPAAETTAIAEALTRLALGHPAVGFRLTSASRCLLDAPPVAELRQRAGQVFGAQVARQMIEFTAGERGWLFVQGLAVPPAAATRANRSHMYTSLRGRPVSDRTLAAAILEGYQGLLMVRRFPVCVLDLELAPGEVDVNAHPTKQEVRFSSSRAVFGLVRGAIREALARADIAPRIDSGAPRHQPQQPQQTAGTEAAKERAAGDAVASPALGGRVAEKAVSYDLWRGPSQKDAAVAAIALASLGSSLQPSLKEGHARADAASLAPAEPQEQPGSVPQQGDSQIGPYRLLGQLHRTYILIETDESLRIFDQHALHERILYDQLTGRASCSSGAEHSQRLLVPETLDLTPRELSALDEAQDVLSELGFDVAAFSGRTVAITAVPQLLGERAAAPFLRNLLGDVADNTNANTNEDAARASAATFRSRVLARLACAAAVKAGDRLLEAEMQTLLDGFAAAAAANAPPPQTCPHGRPTSLVLSLTELARRFGRS